MAITASGENLIFVISQPRSGSTLLQRVLSNHAEVGTLAEPWLMLNPVYGLKRTGIETEYNFFRARIALDDFLSQLPQGEEIYLRGLRQMACVIYNEACASLNKPRFLDKTPPYYFIIPELYRIFPKASYIILLRNPLAVFNSVLSTWIRGDWAKLSNHYHSLMTAPQKLVEGIQHLGDAALVVHYENFVENSESETANICKYIGIGYDPNMLVYGQAPALSGHMGDPTGVGQHVRPEKTSLDLWMDMGRDKQTRVFAQEYLKALGPQTISAMGYSYNDLEDALNSVKCEKNVPTISLHKAFAVQKTFWEKAQLLALELIQKRQVLHIIKQFIKLILGKR